MQGTIFNFFLFTSVLTHQQIFFFHSALTEKCLHHPFAFVKGFTIIRQTFLTDKIC